jgi:hypothetical protein
MQAELDKTQAEQERIQADEDRTRTEQERTQTEQARLQATVSSTIMDNSFDSDEPSPVGAPLTDEVSSSSKMVKRTGSPNPNYIASSVAVGAQSNTTDSASLTSPANAPTLTPTNASTDADDDESRPFSATDAPTKTPTKTPTVPTASPTKTPTVPTASPTDTPTSNPTISAALYLTPNTLHPHHHHHHHPIPHHPIPRTTSDFSSRDDDGSPALANLDGSDFSSRDDDGGQSLPKVELTDPSQMCDPAGCTVCEGARAVCCNSFMHVNGKCETCVKDVGCHDLSRFQVSLAAKNAGKLSCDPDQCTVCRVAAASCCTDLMHSAGQAVCNKCAKDAECKGLPLQEDVQVQGKWLARSRPRPLAVPSPSALQGADADPKSGELSQRILKLEAEISGQLRIPV